MRFRTSECTLLLADEPFYNTALYNEARLNTHTNSLLCACTVVLPNTGLILNWGNCLHALGHCLGASRNLPVDISTENTIHIVPPDVEGENVSLRLPDPHWLYSRVKMLFFWEQGIFLILREFVGFPWNNSLGVFLPHLKLNLPLFFRFLASIVICLFINSQPELINK